MPLSKKGVQNTSETKESRFAGNKIRALVGAAARASNGWLRFHNHPYSVARSYPQLEYQGTSAPKEALVIDVYGAHGSNRSC